MASFRFFVTLAALLATLGAPLAEPANPATPHTAVEHLPWTRQAVIYQVNVRQYTPEGTLKALVPELERIRSLGVDVIWLMPVQPIGSKGRKGTLGSYYSVRDYTAVNPEFGTLDDFKAVVRRAHELGMKVILDWVANHTALDHPWIDAHPDWYQKNARGEITSYEYDDGHGNIEHWSDVAGLDYRVPALRAAMKDAMSFWVRETDLDGFRCDVAMRVPTDFWDDARSTLDRMKPMFMLAEAETPELAVHAFDMTYAWTLGNRFIAIGRGKADATALVDYYRKPPVVQPTDSYSMLFTSNHDFNSWTGSDAELYGPLSDAFSVLTYTLPGMPLIYGGQEAGYTRRLEFFEKDPIRWKTYARAPLYTWLSGLKHHHPALAAGEAGGRLEIIETGNPEVFAFRRVKGRDVVTVAVNLSFERQRLKGVSGLSSLPPAGYRVTPAR